MYNKIFLSSKQLQLLSVEERLKYFNKLRDYCTKLETQSNSRNGIIQRALKNRYFKSRSFFYEVQGEFNIPQGQPVLFVSNHTSSRDFFTILEVFEEMGKDISILANEDGLVKISKSIFTSCGATLVDRRNIESCDNGMSKLTSDLLAGKSGFMFGESMLNLHPYELVRPYQDAAVHIATVANVPIIPVTIEYLETPMLVETERDLYQKCIIKFGKPYNVDERKNLTVQTESLESIATLEREIVLQDLGIVKGGLDGVDPNRYLNHTHLKKYGLRTFPYDTAHDIISMYLLHGIMIDNEFREDSSGNLIPGITNKNDGKKYVKRFF